MKYEVLQRTHYTYSMPVKQSINKCIFKPLSNENQKLLAYEQRISPEAECSEHYDYWQNDVVTFYIWDSHNELLVETRSLLELNHPELNVAISIEEEETMYSKAFKEQFAEFLMPTAYTYLQSQYIQEVIDLVGGGNCGQYTFVERLNHYIYDTFTYLPGSTDVKTTADEAFVKKTGVCQDFTHIMIAICRKKGIPARYVSGYIYSGEDVAMRGNSVTHAWVEVYFPSFGWIGFDPTNDMLAQDQHICVAIGRDYSDITPLKGVYLGSGTQKLTVSISVKAV